jgi:flagellar basal body P-ring protein FlgI
MNQRVWVVGAVLLGLCGCASSQKTRLQSAEEVDRDPKYGLQTIGDKSSVGNADPIPVSGVGLVVGLEGTGGGAPPGGFRTMLEDQLRKRKPPVEHIKEVMASPNTSLVLVSGQLPAGAHKGDPIDVAITLPPGSKTRSLRGGYLVMCDLYNYDSTRNLNPQAQGDSMLRGHVMARAEGPLLVGFGDGDDANKERHARIWGGGRSLIDRPFFLLMNSDEQKARIAQSVAEAVNQTFHGEFRGPLTDLAKAETPSVVYVAAPPQYKLNLPHFLRVVRLIPLETTQGARIEYQRRLERELLDPARTVTAALRLEALGSDSIPVLKRGLQGDSPLVRFCSAEALAYLDDPSCGQELARTVEQAPVLRAYALTALASMDAAISHVELRRLLDSPSAETKYGAFRALRALDEREETIQGDLLNESFWLHHVAPASPLMVHVSTRNRAEIVLFGDNVRMVAPFSILAGEYVVAAGKEDDKCTVTRISYRHGTSKRQCTLKLEEVLRTLADLGATYPDVVDVLRRAEHCQCLNCKTEVDALPQSVEVSDLALAGAGDQELLQAHPEILGPTPNLYEKGRDGRRTSQVGNAQDSAK